MEKFILVDFRRKVISLLQEVLIVMFWSDNQDLRKREDKVLKAQEFANQDTEPIKEPLPKPHNT